MTYELWDRSSRNLLGEFPTSEAAFELVREILEDEGRASALSLVLSMEDDVGHSERVAAGDDLVELATQAPPRSATG